MPPSHAPRRVAVTGSRGLIGTALTEALTAAGYEVRGLDLRGEGAELGDVRVRDHLDRALDGCVGVVHLAAVSRVIDGERDPAGCWRTNVEGTRTVLESASANGRPWVIYASSREVYGHPEVLPVSEEALLQPCNIYGRSKAAAEALVGEADLPTSILRFSNVYGTTTDHADRVVPAFARQAAFGLPLRVDGAGHTFDFTHLSDTVRGVMATIERMERGFSLPPLHLLTGTPTTLGTLASLAIDLAGSGSTIHEAPPRSYDVAGFYGDPSRAATLLGWHAGVSLPEGLRRLIEDFRALSCEVS